MRGSYLKTSLWKGSSTIWGSSRNKSPTRGSPPCSKWGRSSVLSNASKTSMLNIWSKVRLRLTHFFLSRSEVISLQNKCKTYSIYQTSNLNVSSFRKREGPVRLVSVLSRLQDSLTKNDNNTHPKASVNQTTSRTRVTLLVGSTKSWKNDAQNCQNITKKTILRNYLESTTCVSNFNR